jgi:Fe-S-cluster containining protein
MGAEAVAHGAHRLMDDEKRAAEARSLGGAPACTEGCALCCHVHVEVTVPELAAIRSYLRGALPEPALTAFRERLERHVARTAPMADEARWAARIPCALLDERGRCSVYAVRPLRCRAFHSVDADACRLAFEGASDAETAENPRVARVLSAVEAGYDDALAAANLPSGAARLESGLLALLKDDGGAPGSRPG